jgi:hypothetical protein
MRVLLLNYEYPPCGSGAGLATEALAEGLASRGVSVDVVAGGDRASSDPRLLWDGDAQEEGLLTVHRVPSRRLATHEAGMRGAMGYLAAAPRSSGGCSRASGTMSSTSCSRCLPPRCCRCSTCTARR